MSPSATVFPSLVHVIFGVGFPVAAHWKVSMSPSTTILSGGLRIILGGSKNVKIEIENNTSLQSFLIVMTLSSVVWF